MAPVWLTDEDVEQIDVLDKVPVADEFVSDSLPGTLSYRRGQRGIIEQQVQPVPETAQIVVIRQQQPSLPSAIWSWIPPTAMSAASPRHPRRVRWR